MLDQAEVEKSCRFDSIYVGMNQTLDVFPCYCYNLYRLSVRCLLDSISSQLSPSIYFRAWPNYFWIPSEIEECPRYWNFWMWFYVDNSNIQRRASSYRSASVVEDPLWSRISIPQQWVKIIFNRPHLSISTRRYHSQYTSLKCPRIRVFDPLNPWTYAENAHHSHVCVLIKSSFPSSPKS